MAPMKRKGTFAARAAKKSRSSKLVPTVVDALAAAECLPSGLRSLLKQALPIVFNANKVDRHDFENEVVAQAKQALDTVEATLQKEHQTALAAQSVMIAPKESASREKAKKDAEAHLEAVKAKMEGNKADKKAAEKNVQEAENALKSAQQEAKVAEKDLQKVVDKKAHLSDCLATEFVMLKEGTSTSAVGKKAVQKLLALGKEYGLDSTLLQTFPITCKKQAATRTEFETTMFTSLQALIERQIDAMSQKVGEVEPIRAAKVAAVEGAKDALGKAEAVLTAANEALDCTHAAHKEASKAVAQADSSVRKIWEDMRRACDAQDDLANDLKNFKEHILVAFQQLKDKEPESEPVEEPEAVEEEAAAAAEPVAEPVAEAVAA